MPASHSGSAAGADLLDELAHFISARRTPGRVTSGQQVGGYAFARALMVTALASCLASAVHEVSKPCMLQVSCSIESVV